MSRIMDVYENSYVPRSVGDHPSILQTIKTFPGPSGTLSLLSDLFWNIKNNNLYLSQRWSPHLNKRATMPKVLKSWVSLLWNPSEPWSRLIYIFSSSSILITIGIFLANPNSSSVSHTIGLGMFLVGDILAILGILLATCVTIYLMFTRMYRK